VPNSGSLVNHTRKPTRINTVFDRRDLHDSMKRMVSLYAYWWIHRTSTTLRRLELESAFGPEYHPFPWPVANIPTPLASQRSMGKSVGPENNRVSYLVMNRTYGPSFKPFNVAGVYAQNLSL
jgi:hypothetical protein